MRLKTPCCTNPLLVYFLILALVIGIISYYSHHTNNILFASIVKFEEKLQEGFRGKEEDVEGEENAENAENAENSDEKGILAKPAKSKKKIEWRTAEEWSLDKRPKFDVHYEPFNAKYVELYDKLTFVTKKFDYETLIITKHINKSRMFSGIHILDVGCGTGHHVAFLKNKGFDVTGIDRSHDVIDYCKKVHTEYETSFKIGDAMRSTQFRDKTFSHILCLNNTIYYMDDIPLFFKNCAAWLKEDGILFVHMIDEVELRYFETNGWVNAKNGIKYKSSYDIQGKKTIVTEKIKDKDNNAMLNQHTLYNVGKTDLILKAVIANGFAIIKKYTLKKSGFRHQYIYVLQI